MIPTVIEHSRGGDNSTDLLSAMLLARSIFIVGQITDEDAAIVIAELLYLESEHPSGTVNIYINSPGGSVTAGLAIYDTMRHVGYPIRTLCMGQACSMAALILAAGDERCMLPSSRAMIHQPSGGALGKESDIVIAAEEITRMRKELVTRLARHTGKTEKRIFLDIDKDKFMSAEAAVEYGLADRVVEPRTKRRMK